MLNFEIEPEILLPFVPKGTELDAWNGKTFVSMVGFLFLNTRVWGLAVPFHRDFEEINLRFYVRRKAADGWRRGVVFVKEIVPRAAIAFMARWLYNENYVALPTGNVILRSQHNQANVESVKYFWSFKNKPHFIELVTRGEPSHFTEGSEEEFIVQHHWGYTSQKDGGTIEYQVEHPPWRIWQAQSCRLDCDVEKLYGERFVSALSANPSSAFLAEGSEIAVYQGRRMI
jgi:uncharacterized protein YqjF (DUF2071 family)